MQTLPRFFSERSWLLRAVLVLIFALGLGIRLFDLTDLPLDFSSTRQLHSAINARGMYYQYAEGVPDWQRQMAYQQWKQRATIEPPVMETLVAHTYRLFGEHLWIARIYSSLFWIIGGIALYLLARELISTEGALFAALFYLFLPYGIIASRSFQPDPLMTSLIVLGVWSLFRWHRTSQWRWVVLAGILNGLALFVKNVAVFPVAGALAGVFLGCRGFRKSLKDPQVWVILVMTALPVAIYTIYGVFISGFLGRQFGFRFFPEMWLEPAFYLRWNDRINGVVGDGAFLLALIGMFLAQAKTQRPVLFGLWVGYFAFGLTFPYHFSTHAYYQLPLIPIVSLSLAPMAQLVSRRLLELNPSFLIRSTLAGILVVAVAVSLWNVRVTLVREDYRSEVAYWAALGDKLGHGPDVVALSHDYGLRLAYWGWQDTAGLFTIGDIRLRELAGRDVDPIERFQEDIQGKRYLLVTLFGELEKQPRLKEYIYQHYPIYDQGDGYIIFDLQHPLETPTPSK